MKHTWGILVIVLVFVFALNYIVSTLLMFWPVIVGALVGGIVLNEYIRRRRHW